MKNNIAQIKSGDKVNITVKHPEGATAASPNFSGEVVSIIRRKGAEVFIELQVSALDSAVNKLEESWK